MKRTHYPGGSPARADLTKPTTHSRKIVQIYLSVEFGHPAGYFPDAHRWIHISARHFLIFFQEFRVKDRGIPQQGIAPVAKPVPISGIQIVKPHRLHDPSQHGKGPLPLAIDIAFIRDMASWILGPPGLFCRKGSGWMRLLTIRQALPEWLLRRFPEFAFL